MGSWIARKRDDGDIEITGWEPNFKRGRVTRNPFKDREHLPMDKWDYRNKVRPVPNPLHGVEWFRVIANGPYDYTINNGDGWLQHCTGHHVIVRPCEAPPPRPPEDRTPKCIVLASFTVEQTMQVNWHQDRSAPWTHTVADEPERFYVHAPGATPQQVADAYLAGYEIHEDMDDGSPVRFDLEDAAGNELGSYQGRPGEPAQRVREWS